MQIVRTLALIVFTAFIAMFVMVNYGEKQDVIIWPTSQDAFVVNWPVGVTALVFWLLGVVPTWIYHRSVKWSQERRIRSLEASIKSSALAHRSQAASSAGADSKAASADEKLSSLDKDSGANTSEPAP
ncbi:MAG: LapA family protein [Erythrobacter sp.]